MEIPRSFRIAAVGLLSLSCGTLPPKAKPLEQPQPQYTLKVSDSNFITRINSDTLMLVTYGFTNDGIEYIRGRGCQIESIDNLSQHSMRIDLLQGTGTDCLPELK